MTVELRKVEMFRPYNDEFPEQLLWDVDADEACVEHWRGAQLVRYAKYQGEPVAMYAMDHTGETTFNLYGVVVSQRLRKQGLGRWVVGHAIGVAESKGGRQVSLPGTGGSRCFTCMGFVADGSGWRYDLIQE